MDKHGLYPKLQTAGDPDKLVSTVRKHIGVESAEGFETATRNKAAVILAIQFESKDAVQAAAVANDIAQLFIDADLNIHSLQARLTTEFLKRELVKAERDLEEHAKELTTFRQEHRGELPSELAANQARYDRLQERRAALVSQVAEAERRVRTMNAGVFPADDSPGAQMQRLRAELSRELAVHTEQHPDVIRLREEMALLEGELGGGEGGAVDESLYQLSVREGRAQIAYLNNQIAELDAALIDLDGRIERTHQWAEALAGMEQKAAIYTDAFDQLLRKVEGAERAEDLYRAQQGAKVKILDNARPPLEATSRRIQIGLAGLIGALLAGVGVGFLLEWRDPVISTLPSKASRAPRGFRCSGRFPASTKPRGHRTN